MNKYAKILLIIFFMLLTSCFFYAVRYDGTYRGKVINADTGEPITGAVVLGTWYTEVSTVAGPKHDFYDAEEAVTDENGEFEISGKGIRILSNLEPMSVLIFKAGYNYIGGSWESLRESKYYRERIKWEGDKAIIPLKKLTMEERRKQSTPSRPNIPDEKMKLLTEEINKERIARGLKPFTGKRE